jgi:hypothetical protein
MEGSELLKIALEGEPTHDGAVVSRAPMANRVLQIPPAIAPAYAGGYSTAFARLNSRLARESGVSPKLSD